MGVAHSDSARTAELEAVVVALERAGPGLVLTGALGIGKTHLARAAFKEMARRGFAVAWVQASASARELPLGALAPHLPAAGDAEAGVGVLVLAREALRGLGGDRRLVIVVDDAPMLDSTSALALSQAAAVGDTTLLLTQRMGTSLPDPLSALRLPRHMLSPLDEAAAASLAEHVLGGPIDRTSLRRIVALSDGNPLYLSEIVVAGNDSGAWIEGPNGSALHESVAGTARLAELVGSRFDGLDDGPADAAALLALGEPLGLALVSELTSHGAVEALDEAGLLQVVVDGRRTQLRLAHPLYTEVLRERMSVLRRRRLYRMLADTVMATGARRRDDLMRVASWYLDAGGAVPADLLTSAGTHARVAGDTGLAIRLLRASFEQAPSFAAGIVLADTIYREGRSTEVDGVLDRVEELDLSDDQRVTCLMARAADRYWNVGDADATEQLFQQALAIATGPIRSEVEALRASLLAASRRYAEAVPVALACLEGPPGPGHIDAAVALAWGLRARGRGGEAIAALDRVLDAYAALGGRAIAMTTQVLGSAKAGAQIDLGLLDDADACAASTTEAAEVTGEVAALAFAALCRGSSDMSRGRFRSARANYEESAALMRQMHRPSMLRWALIGLVHASAEAGDVDAAQAHRDELERVGPHPATLFDAILARADAAILRAAGRIEAAMSVLLAGAAESARCEDYVAEAACRYDVVRLGRPEAVASRLAELALTVDGEWVPAFSAHASAAVRSDPEGLGAASARFETIGARAHAAAAAEEAADAFARAGDQRSASRWSLRADDLWAGVERSGRVSAAGLGGADPLTRREREVAELAAEGHRSRVIAERLFLSTRTVESHLLRAYSKLGVRSRTELSDLLSGRPQPNAG
jgi:DNA-binding CsgD family transcriptional regulator